MFPQNSQKFQEANKFASKLEKKKYPQGFKELAGVDRKLPSGEILGHITKKGDISTSKKVPKHLRGEVAFHENVERNRILGLGKK